MVSVRTAEYFPGNGIHACGQDYGNTKVYICLAVHNRNDCAAVTIRGRGNLKEMADLSKIVGQLKKERDRVQQQLSGLNAALAAFAGVYSGGSGKSLPGAKRKRRPMSAKGRAAIRRAQKARWAKVRAANKK